LGVRSETLSDNDTLRFPPSRVETVPSVEGRVAGNCLHVGAIAQELETQNPEPE